MSEDARTRLAHLVKTGRELVDELGSLDDDAWIDFGEVKIYETWLGSVGQLLLAVEGPESEYFGRFRDIVNSQKNPVGVKAYLVRRVLDLSISVFEDWSCGSLRRFEDMVAAPILDEFLDRAEDHESAGRLLESLALARAVMEHALMRVAVKQGIRVGERSAAALIDRLAESEAIDEGTSLGLRSAIVTGEAPTPEMLTRLITDLRTLVGHLA